MKLLVVKEAQQIKVGDELIAQFEWLAGAREEPSRVLAVSQGADGLTWIETQHTKVRLGRLSLVCVLTPVGTDA